MNKVMTGEFRVSWPQVFEPKLDQSGNGPFYSLQMIFDKGDDLSKLEALIESKIQEKWGTKRPSNLILPLRDGDEERSDQEAYKNKLFANAKTKFKPGLVNAQVEPIIDQTEFYPGCYARATLTAYAWEKAGKRGVSFGPVNIQKTRDGERLDGAVSAENEFEAIAQVNDANFSL